jgi:acetoacetyl-CoA synthetase
MRLQFGFCTPGMVMRIREFTIPIAMMAATAIGAIWAAAPEFGVKTVIDRFSQIEPKLLFAADGYRFGGKDFTREAEVRRIASELTSLERVIWLPYLHENAAPPDLPNLTGWSELMSHPDVPRERFEFEHVEYDHPIWIVFSSGTTGLPKAIVHSHVGVLLEHLKLMHLQLGPRPGSNMLFYHDRLDDVEPADCHPANRLLFGDV